MSAVLNISKLPSICANVITNWQVRAQTYGSHNRQVLCDWHGVINHTICQLCDPHGCASRRKFSYVQSCTHFRPLARPEGCPCEARGKVEIYDHTHVFCTNFQRDAKLEDYLPLHAVGINFRVSTQAARTTLNGAYVDRSTEINQGVLWLCIWNIRLVLYGISATF